MKIVYNEDSDIRVIEILPSDDDMGLSAMIALEATLECFSGKVAREFWIETHERLRTLLRSRMGTGAGKEV